MLPMCSEEIRPRVTKVLKKCGLYRQLQYDWDKITEAAFHDKKADGDTVTVTLTLSAAQPMSHLHITSPRPANAEPVNTLPFWDWSSGSRVMPGDSGSDLFIGTLQRGITTIQYTWKITHAGDCVVEPARATLMYAPDFAARTEATRLTTRAK
jgi:uncharacterized protein YfaS (alpha-2-macroglobulin family)